MAETLILRGMITKMVIFLCKLVLFGFLVLIHEVDLLIVQVVYHYMMRRGSILSTRLKMMREILSVELMKILTKFFLLLGYQELMLLIVLHL